MDDGMDKGIHTDRHADFPEKKIVSSTQERQNLDSPKSNDFKIYDPLTAAIPLVGHSTR